MLQGLASGSKRTSVYVINNRYLRSVIREIITYENYYDDFIATLSVDVIKKFHYVFDLLSTEARVSKKFVKHVREGIYEIRVIYTAFSLFSTRTKL